MNTLYENIKSRGQKILITPALPLAVALLVFVLIVGTMYVRKYIGHTQPHQSPSNLVINKNSDAEIELASNPIFTGKNPCEGLNEKDCITQMKSLYYFIPYKSITLPKTPSNPENILSAQGAQFFWEYTAPGVKDYTKAPAFMTYQINCNISKKTCVVGNTQLSYSIYRTFYMGDNERVPGRYAVFNESVVDYKIIEDSADKLVARVDYTAECGRVEIEVNKKDNVISVRNYGTCISVGNKTEIDSKEFSSYELQ